MNQNNQINLIEKVGKEIKKEIRKEFRKEFIEQKELTIEALFILLYNNLYLYTSFNLIRNLIQKNCREDAIKIANKIEKALVKEIEK